MSLFLSIYLLGASLFIFFPMLLKGAVRTVLGLLFFPVIPFLIAYRIRQEKPVQSVLIYALWGSFYALVTLISILDLITH
jgi:hypothetical protein